VPTLACTVARADSARKLNVIDRLREQIEERLDQLLHEADRLRKALAALGPGSSKAPPTTPAPRGAATTTRKAPSRFRPTPTRRTSTARGSRRTPPGATVSTTLSKLARSGEVEKAERGYRLPTPSGTTPSSSDT
jgi:hypothetical protein